jgi:hypothetical protein
MQQQSQFAVTCASQGMQSIAGNHQKLEEARKGSSLQHRREARPAENLISDL